MIRAFVAFKINPETVENIAAARAQLKRHLPGVRWVAKENIHVTLKFLGEIDEAQIAPITRALEGAIRPFPRLTINAKGLGVFPDEKRPRILWVGLQGSRLSALAPAVEKALEPVGFLSEKRGFAPHLTIGRWRQFQGSKAELEKQIEQWKNYDFGETSVHEVILYQSILKPEGAVHRPLQVIRFADQSPRI